MQGKSGQSLSRCVYIYQLRYLFISSLLTNLITIYHVLFGNLSNVELTLTQRPQHICSSLNSWFWSESMFLYSSIDVVPLPLFNCFTISKYSLGSSGAQSGQVRESCDCPCRRTCTSYCTVSRVCLVVIIFVFGEHPVMYLGGHLSVTIFMFHCHCRYNAALKAKLLQKAWNISVI